MGSDPAAQGGAISTSNPNLEELRGLVRQLSHLAGLSVSEEIEFGRSEALGLRQISDDEVAKFVATELAWRSRRKEAFGAAAMLGEPTWEMLLDLFVNGERGDQVTVTSACIAAGVPITTAIRYIAALVDAGLVARRPSADDGRMHLVELTRRGRALVRESVVSRLHSLDVPR